MDKMLKKQISVRISDTHNKNLKAMASVTQCSQAEIIARAIEAYYKNFLKSNK